LNTGERNYCLSGALAPAVLHGVVNITNNQKLYATAVGMALKLLVDQPDVL